MNKSIGGVVKDYLVTVPRISDTSIIVVAVLIYVSLKHHGDYGANAHAAS